MSHSQQQEIYGGHGGEEHFLDGQDYQHPHEHHQPPLFLDPNHSAQNPAEHPFPLTVEGEEQHPPFVHELDRHHPQLHHYDETMAAAAREHDHHFQQFEDIQQQHPPLPGEEEIYYDGADNAYHHPDEPPAHQLESTVRVQKQHSLTAATVPVRAAAEEEEEYHHYQQQHQLELELLEEQQRKMAAEEEEHIVHDNGGDGVPLAQDHHVDQQQQMMAAQQMVDQLKLAEVQLDHGEPPSNVQPTEPVVVEQNGELVHGEHEIGQQQQPQKKAGEENGKEGGEQQQQMGQGEHELGEQKMEDIALDHHQQQTAEKTGEDEEPTTPIAVVPPKNSLPLTELMAADTQYPVPYRSKLTEQFEPGQTLIVKGKTAEDSVRFTINLHHASADFSGNDVPLHVSVRFDEGKIVFNTFSKGEWGKEERKSNPYKKGDDIDFRIRAHDSKFTIYADQKEIKEYEHRVPLSSISHFSIDGDILVTHIHWGGKYYPVPYESGITGDGFNPGKTMLIFGTPEKKGKRFHINLLKKNGDIALHFNPRFDEKAIIRNSLIANEWGNEEREGKIPLEKGIGFDLKIVNEEYAFQIFLNDERFCSYAHRMEPHDIHGLQIGGDVEITGIQIF